MRVRRFGWAPPAELAHDLRDWFESSAATVDLDPIESAVAERGDRALLELTARFDATDRPPESIAIEPEAARAALDRADPELAGAMGVAIANVGKVASAQLGLAEATVELDQGQTVTVGEAPVGAAAIYAPGGRAAYPSTVIMGCVTAAVAGVGRIVLCSPPGPDGRLHPATLAAAGLCGVEEVYAVGGAQAIFALARGTESIEPVDVIAGPGNAWVQAAKRRVFGEVGIDSLAGPSDLMVVLDGSSDAGWAALDLCAQAEHGSESPLVAVSVGADRRDELEREVVALAGAHPSIKDAPLALLAAGSESAAIELANAFAPEHLQLMGERAASMASRATTAGAVFTGPFSGTAFGDYVAGSNHVLPTGGTGRFFGPLGPSVFRRRTARVSLGPDSARKLAPHVDVLARSEGLPVHGMSATARGKR